MRRGKCSVWFYWLLNWCERMLNVRLVLRLRDVKIQELTNLLTQYFELITTGNTQHKYNNKDLSRLLPTTPSAERLNEASCLDIRSNNTEINSTAFHGRYITRVKL